MSYIVICSAALLVSALTLFSGFGLGTLLMPVFALFFPLEVAVAATAVVHGANNIFKIMVFGQKADRTVVLKFGIPAIIAAFAGVTALGYLSGVEQVATYTLGSRTAVITPLKLIMAALMLAFSLFELLPGLRRLHFDRKYLFLGGMLSGFFGGLSGHQGALRSAFLAKTGVSTEAFVGTNAVIGFMVDMARLISYAALFFMAGKAGAINPEQWPLIMAGILAAFSGVRVGKRFLKKITIKTIQTFTGILLFGIALALGSGLV
nr:sulfite exporter TauE/SafE family protein [Desulfobulbaceae bacterium]